MSTIINNKLVDLNKNDLLAVINDLISCQQIINNDLLNDIEIYQELKIPKKNNLQLKI